MKENISPRLKFLISRITILFVVSYIFLWLHILDDALITNEPAWYGISILEFLLYCAFIYAIVPPLGLWLARRGSLFGILIVMGYAFQAMYGGGANHVRHIFGDFRGSQFLPVVLNAFGVQVTDIRGHGFGTVVMGMAGLGITPPHEHILASTIVAFINIGLNAALILFCGLAIYAWFRARRAAHPTSAQSESIVAG